MSKRLVAGRDSDATDLLVGLGIELILWPGSTAPSGLRSLTRRTDLRLPGCQHKGTCSNYPRWPLTWRDGVIDAIRQSENYRPALI